MKNEAEMFLITYLVDDGFDSSRYKFFQALTMSIYNKNVELVFNNNLNRVVYQFCDSSYIAIGENGIATS